MCTQIRFDGDWLETVGELREVLSLIEWDRVYSPPFRDSQCLCCVDVPATMKANGLSFTEEMGDYVVEVKS